MNKPIKRFLRWDLIRKSKGVCQVIEITEYDEVETDKIFKVTYDGRKRIFKSEKAVQNYIERLK